MPVMRRATLNQAPQRGAWLRAPAAGPAVTQAAYRFYADGTEAGAAALAAQDTATPIEVGGGDVNVALRMRLQSTTGAALPATDDWQLQVESNASGTWAPVPFPETLADSYSEVTAGTNSTFGYIGGPIILGQSFTGDGQRLSRAGFYMNRLGSPVGNVTATLYAHSGTFGTSSVGTGAALATSTAQNAATVSTTNTWVDFVFDSGPVLAAGTRYVICLEASGFSNASNCLRWRTDSVSATHPGNSSSFISSWAASATIDRAFRVYTAAGSASLTEGEATTNRLGAGSGSFVAGKVSEDGLVDNLGWTATNYTEVVYWLTLQRAALADGDTLRYRVLRNGSTTGLTYTQTPTVAVAKTTPAVTQGAYRFYADGTETGSAALAAQDTAPAVDVSAGDVNVALRTRLQSTNAAGPDATDDWQLQWERNASGTWVNVNGAVGLADRFAGPTPGAFALIDSTQKFGQSFLGNGQALTRAGFYLRKTGAPPGNIVAQLFAHTGTFGAGGVATGAALATSTPVAASTVGTANGWVYFDFDGSVTLAPGTPYVIAASVDTTTTVADGVEINAETLSPTHAGNESDFIGGAWANSGTDDLLFEVYTAGNTAVPYNSASLTDGAATTSRLTGGTGTFTAGKMSEDGLVDDLGWAANNHVELLYSITLKQADLANGDTVRFRVLRNGSTTTLTYAQTPTTTIAKTAGSTLTESFTGTDGVGTPPAGWTKYEGFTTVHETFQGNRWAIQTNGGFEGGAMTYTAAAYTDVSFAITVTHPNPSGGDTYSGLGVRISGNHNGWDTLYCEGYNGYHAWIDQTAKSVHLAQMTGGAYDPGELNVGISPALCALGASARMRLEAVGTTVRVKVWDPAGAEPATWDLSTTFTGYSTGYIGFRVQPQSNSFTYWDDAAWTDLSAGGPTSVAVGGAVAATSLVPAATTAATATATPAAVPSTSTVGGPTLRAAAALTPVAATSTVPAPVGRATALPAPVGSTSTVLLPVGLAAHLAGPVASVSTVPAPTGKAAALPAPVASTSAVLLPVGLAATVLGPVAAVSSVPTPTVVAGASTTVAAGPVASTSSASPGGTAFAPNDVAGLGLWLDASQLGLTAGQSVTSWPDLSGGGHTGVVVGTPAPVISATALNARPVVAFAALGGRVRITGTGIDQDYTLAVVARVTSHISARVVSAANPPSNLFYGWWQDTEDNAYAGSFFTPDVSHTATFNWKLYSADGASSSYVPRLFLDGTFLTGTTTQTIGWGGTFNLSGWEPLGTGETGDCEVAEVVLYNRKLSDVERAQVESYLRTKWITGGPAGAGGLTIHATANVAAGPVASTSQVGAVTLTFSGAVAVAAVASTSGVGGPTLRAAVALTPVGSTSLVPAPTAKAAATPAAVPSTSLVGTPTVKASATVAAAPVPSTSAVGTPTLVFSGAVTVAAVGSTSGVGGPTLRAAVALTPVASTSAVPTPTVLTGADTVVTPAAVAATSTVPAPTGKATALPAAVPSTSTVGAPAVLLSSSTAAGPVPSTSLVPTPTVTASATVPAGPVPATSTVGTPTLVFSGAVTVSAVGSTSGVGGPLLRAAVALSPVGATSLVPAPAILFSSSAAAGPVPATSLVGVPAIHATATVPAGPVPAASTVGAVTIVFSGAVAVTAVGSTSGVGGPLLRAAAALTPVASTSTVPAPTILFGGSTAAGPVPASSLVGVPTVTATATVTPAAVPAASSVGAVTIAFSGAVAVSAVGSTSGVGGPLLRAAVALSPVAATSSVLTPAILFGGSVVAGPVLSTSLVPTPAVTASATAAAGPVASVSLVGAVTLVASAAAAVSAVGSTSGVGGPLLQAAAALTPVAATSAVGTPTLLASATAPAGPVPSTSLVPAPSIFAGGGATVVPTPVAATSAVGTPTIHATATVTPGTTLPLLDENGLPLLDETGDPLLSEFTPGPVASTSLVPAPAGRAVAQPAAVAATSTVGAVTLVASAAAAVAAVGSTSGVGGPLLRAAAALSPVPATSSVPTPTIIAGAGATATPAPVASISLVPTPAVLTGSDATATPAPVASTSTVPAPTGRVTALPAAVLATSTVGGPLLRATTQLTPVASTSTVPTPTVLTGADATATPAPVASISLVAAPLGRATALPAPVGSTSTVGGPLLRATAPLVPVAAISAVPTPSILAGANATATPAPVASTSLVPAPTGRATALPAPVSSTSSVGAVTLRATAAVAVSAVGSTSTVGGPLLRAAVGLPPVAATSTVPPPAVSASTTFGVTPVGATSAVPNAVITASATVAAGPVVALSGVGTPTLATTLTVTLGPVGSASAVGAAGLDISAAVTLLSPVPATSRVGTPTIIIFSVEAPATPLTYAVLAPSATWARLAASATGAALAGSPTWTRVAPSATAVDMVDDDARYVRMEVLPT